MGRGLLLLVTAAVLVAGCGQEPSVAPVGEGAGPSGNERAAREPQAEATGAPEAAAPDPDPGADDAPDAPLAEGLGFVLPAVGGGQVVGAELAGRDVALWFWAPW